MFFVSVLHAAKDGRTDGEWILRICLALCFLLGAAGGYLCALSCAEQSEPALLEYLNGYCRLFSDGGKGKISLLSTFELYFGHTFLVFLFGYVVWGILAIPVITAECGFSAMFAVACILQVYGKKGLVIALACLALRMLFTLPCILWLGAYAWSMSLMTVSVRRGKRVAGVENGGYVLCFGVCCFVLLIGMMLERSVTPGVFTWMLSFI